MKISELDLEEMRSLVAKAIVKNSEVVAKLVLVEMGLSKEDSSLVADCVHGQISDGGAEDTIWDCLDGGIRGHMGESIRALGRQR